MRPMSCSACVAAAASWAVFESTTPLSTLVEDIVAKRLSVGTEKSQVQMRKICRCRRLESEGDESDDEIEMCY